ncbi:MAG: FapA family protein [Spirochaetaceae bacterium]|jgi:uncharacterized protein (DUF342 family)|nr:FapA family protein [Spirochaetaceae bacterium]
MNGSTKPAATARPGSSPASPAADSGASEQKWITFKVRPKNKNDARLVVYISTDYMETRADFYPAKEGGRPFTKEYIDRVLKKLDICFGVEYKTLDDTADESNAGGTILQGVVIARGIPPVDDSPAYFKINPGMEPRKQPLQTSGGRVDFRTVSSYTTVSAGDEIARQVEPVQGRTGKTIKGQEVPFKRIQRRELIEGKGIYIKNDSIYAEIPGLLKVEGSTISVERTLRLQEPVGYATGNINFTGDLVLEGEVSDGFKVHSGGNITVRRTFAVSDCFSQGDIVVSGGLIGRRQGVVKANGSVDARFMRNCKLACKKNVHIRAEVFNSTIWTMGILDMGTAGRIAGSSVYALHGVTAGSIGGKSANPSVIRLGVDWAAESVIKNNARTLRILKSRIETLNRILKNNTHTADALKQIKEQMQKAVLEYKQTAVRQTEIKKNLVTDKKAFLTVYGAVFAGTLILICSAKYTVKDNMSGVKFVLNSSGTDIIPQKL